MPDKLLDFRSDTVTRPTPGMRQAMAEAAVGDDVFGEDPTVKELESSVAEKLGLEAALFVPSGTMSNQIGIRLHCQPGHEMLCEANCHLYYYEQAGYAQLSGIAARTVEGRFGVVAPEQMADILRPANTHFPRTRLLCLENTHNRGGGRIQPYAVVEAICRWAHANGLRTHLDGARLFNAVVATGIEAPRWTQHFDTVSVCFSKGLGAPVGSALCGSKDLIAEALRQRKVLGGGMRQAGIIAAGALYALEHHVARLPEDHANAQRLAEGIRNIPGLTLVPESVDTNILFFRLDATLGSAAEFVAKLKSRGLLLLPTGPVVIRAVTHLDVSAADVDQALKVISAVAGEETARSRS
jgi:threonine aldolase